MNKVMIQLCLLSQLCCTSIHMLGSMNNTSTGYVDSNGTTLSYLNGIVYSTDGSKAYIVNSGQAKISIIDTTTNTVTGNIDFLSGTPFGFAVLPTASIGYAAMYNDNDVQRIDLNTNTPIGSRISAVNQSQFIISTPDGSQVYVAGGDAAVAVINTTTNTSTTITIASGLALGKGLAVTPDNAFVYTICSNDTIDVINTSTQIVDNTISDSNFSGLSGGIAITSDNRFAYVVSAGNNEVVIIQLSDNSVAGTVDSTTYPFNSPFSISIIPDDTLAYVTNTGSSLVSIIDLATNTVTGYVDSTDYPFSSPNQSAISPNQPQMYVASQFPADSDEAVNIVFTIATITAPSSLTGISQANVFATQTDLINVISWTAPTSGSTPASYNIYRDAGLTDLIGNVLATADPLQYLDHNRFPGVTYSYYVTSVDESGAESTAINVSVTTQNT